jgi:hypothetical protein
MMGPHWHLYNYALAALDRIKCQFLVCWSWFYPLCICGLTAEAQVPTLVTPGRKMRKWGGSTWQKGLPGVRTFEGTSISQITPRAWPWNLYRALAP